MLPYEIESGTNLSYPSPHCHPSFLKKRERTEVHYHYHTLYISIWLEYYAINFVSQWKIYRIPKKVLENYQWKLFFHHAFL